MIAKIQLWGEVITYPQNLLQLYQKNDKTVQESSTINQSYLEHFGILLETQIFKGFRFQDSPILDVKTYQKPLNLYLDIPFNFNHLITLRVSSLENW